MVDAYGYQGKWRKVISIDNRNTGSGNHSYAWENWITLIGDYGRKVELCIGWKQPPKIDESIVNMTCYSSDDLWYTKINHLD